MDCKILTDGYYGKVTFVERLNQYNLLYGDSVRFLPEKGTYQEMWNWRLEKFYDKMDCIDFCDRYGIKIVIEREVPDPFSDSLPNCIGIFPSRLTPHNI